MTHIERLIAQMDDQIKSFADAVSAGRCDDFGDYQKLCGTIYGLRLAKDVLLDLQKKLELDSDD